MGVSSKIGTIALGVQSAKGTPAAVPTVKFKLAGSPSLSPRRDTARYVTTDRGRDQGLAYISQMRVEGDMPVYLHPDGFWNLMWGVLGAHTAGGTTPNFTDTQTPANALPWWTIWRMVADNLWERLEDCKIVSMTIEGTAGAPPIATVSVLGCDAVWETADTVLATLTSVPWVFHESCGRILIDSVPFPISRVQLSIDNNGAGYQADCINLADVDVGNRDIGLTFTTRYQDPATDPSYAETFYGVKTPVAETHLTAARVAKTFSWEMYRSINESIIFDFPQVMYQAVEVNPDPGGDPIELEVACDVEKVDDATPILTSTSNWIE